MCRRCARPREARDAEKGRPERTGPSHCGIACDYALSSDAVTTTDSSATASSATRRRPRLVHVELARLDVRVGIAGVRRGRRQSGHGRVALPRLAQQVGDVPGVLGDRVRDELERRGEARVEVLTHLGAQQSGRRPQCGARSLALLRRAQHGVEHRRVLEVSGHTHIGDGDEAEPRVAETLLEPLGEDHADAVTQTCLTFTGHGRSFRQARGARCSFAPCRPSPFCSLSREASRPARWSRSRRRSGCRCTCRGRYRLRSPCAPR